MGKDTVKEMTQAEREQLFEEEVQEEKKLSPLELHLLEHSNDYQVDMRDYGKLSEPEIAYQKNILESNLPFKKAFMRMVEGKKISRPCFKGYWFMNHDSKIVIHTRYDQEIKVGDITNTVINTLANDWEVIE